MKGILFSMDAMISVAIVLAIVPILILTTIQHPSEFVNKRSIVTSENIGYILPRVKIGKFLGEQAVNKTFEGNFLKKSEKNLSIAEAIVKLWSSGNQTKKEMAQNITESIFKRITPKNIRWGLSIGNNSVGNSNTSSLISTTVNRIYVTGYKKFEPQTGYVAKAGLLGLKEKSFSSYFFFGGFIGQGNISGSFENIPTDADLYSIEMELNTPKNFTFFLNNQSCGVFEGSDGNLSAIKKTITSNCLDVFNASKKNNFSIEFKGNISRHYIGGGYIKANYKTSQLVSEPKNKTTHNFPGIKGLINVYSSVYVPGNLKKIEGRLHFKANGTLLLKLGNATLYKKENNGTEKIVILDNLSIYSNLTNAGINYSDISRENVPLRLGILGLSKGKYKPIIDAASIIDVSGSMGGSQLDEAKDASNAFTNIILNVTGNRAGMVAYETDIRDYHGLTTDNDSVINSINNLYAHGGTCIGCGILRGIEILQKPKFVNLIEKQTKWKYNTNYPNSTPPEIENKKWTEINYNDSFWEENKTIIGIGKNANTSVDPNGGDYFFRKEFKYDQDDYYNPKFKIRSDDAATVYLNGIVLDNDTSKHTGRYWNRIIGSVKLLDEDSDFYDSFERNNFLNNWTATGTVSIDNTCGSFDGNKATVFDGNNGGDLVFNVPTNQSIISINYRILQGSDSLCENPESGEDLIVEYKNVTEEWALLKAHPGGGSDPAEGSWGYYEFVIPEEKIGERTTVRFRYDITNYDDYWALDNINITLKESRPVSNMLNDGKNVVGVELKNDESTDTIEWITDSFIQWKEGNFTNTTALNGILKLGGESGSETDHTSETDGSSWSVQNLNNNYNEPIVFATSNTENGAQSPKIAKIRNVQSSSFEYKICEHEESDGNCDGHANENLGFVVFEKNLVDSMANVEAGRIDISADNVGEAVTINFDETFSNTPIVIATQQSYNEEGESVVQVPSVDTDSFDVYLCDHDESSSDSCESHGTETIVWIALDPLNNPIPNSEAGLTSSIHDSSWTNQDFSFDFDASPVVISTINSNNGGQEAKPTMVKNVNENSMQIRYCEHDGGDTCDSHNPENVAWFAFEKGTELTAQYVKNGYYRSKVFDAGEGVSWNSSLIGKNVTLGTDFYIEYSDGSEWYSNISEVPDSQYLEYRIFLNSTNDTKTPKVYSVNISYSAPLAEFDLELVSNQRRKKTMVVMSDGEANRETSMTNVPDHDGDGDTTDDAQDHAIEAACRAYEDHNITVYAVGFGSGADERTLNLTAQCGRGDYYFSDVGELEKIFSNISKQILELSFIAQELSISGEYNSKLYPDSYLEFTHSNLNKTKFAKEVEIKQETKKFNNCTGIFFIPSELDVVGAKTTSYSGNYWTHNVSVKSDRTENNWTKIFDLAKYGNDYTKLGDPYMLELNTSYLKSNDTNWVSTQIGLKPGNSSRSCSKYNKVIYTARVEAAVPYGKSFPKRIGHNVTIYYDIDHDGVVDGNSTVSYGTDTDSFVSTPIDVFDLNYTENALDDAFKRLLEKLNFVNTGSSDPAGSFNNPIDVGLSDNIEVQMIGTGGVPFLWGPETINIEVGA